MNDEKGFPPIVDSCLAIDYPSSSSIRVDYSASRKDLKEQGERIKIHFQKQHELIQDLILTCKTQQKAMIALAM